MNDFLIVTKHPNLIKYIDSLQRKNAEQLSFYPLCVFERESKNDRLILGLLNGEPCGYMYMGAVKGTVKIHQVCIQYDARRRLYGAMLVAYVEELANKHFCNGIQLRCGFDIDANDFWKSLGYNCVAIVDGGIRRNRKINIWRKQLQPGLFDDIYIEPAVGKTDASIWQKNKKSGIVTGFSRGIELQRYRRKLIDREKQKPKNPK